MMLLFIVELNVAVYDLVQKQLRLDDTITGSDDNDDNNSSEDGSGSNDDANSDDERSFDTVCTLTHKIWRCGFLIDDWAAARL